MAAEPFTPAYRLPPGPPAARQGERAAPLSSGTADAGGGRPDDQDLDPAATAADSDGAVAAGYRAGLEQGRQEMAAELAAARAALQAEWAEKQAAEAARLEALRHQHEEALAALRHLHASLQEAAAAQQSAWVERASTGAAAILGELLVQHVLAARADPTALAGEVQTRLGGWLGAEPALKVVVAAAQAEELQAALPACTVVGDPALRAGEVRIEGPFGVLDGRTGALTDSVQEAMTGGLDSAPPAAQDLGTVDRAG